MIRHMKGVKQRRRDKLPNQRRKKAADNCRHNGGVDGFLHRLPVVLSDGGGNDDIRTRRGADKQIDDQGNDGAVAPNAATATVFPAPVKLPATAMSEALNSCSRMAVAATGSANSGSLFQMEPCSISSCRFVVSVCMFRFFFL